MKIRFNTFKDGEPILASHMNGYSDLLSRLLRSIETTESAFITETLELDTTASMDYFTGDCLYNVYKTRYPLLTEIKELTVVREGIASAVDPVAVDWLSGRVRLEPSATPLTVTLTYKYLTRIADLGDKAPLLTVDGQPLYWPTMVDLQDDGSLVIREDGKGDYLITATPGGEVHAVRIVTPIVDSLDSTDSAAVLSANQGRILDMKAASATSLSTKALLAEPPSIDPAIVRDLVGCAMTYVNHFADLTVGSQNTLFDDETTREIDNAAFIQACIQGIPYEYSNYAGVSNVRHFKYGITLPDNPYSEGRYSVEDLANYLRDCGAGFYPNVDYSNITPGDLIFIRNDRGAGLKDVYIVIGHVGNNSFTCISLSYNIEQRFTQQMLVSTYGDPIELVARPAYNPTVGLDPRPLINDPTQITFAPDMEALKDYILPVDLKVNMPYTLVIKLKPAGSVALGETIALSALYANGDTYLTGAELRYLSEEGIIYYLKFVTDAHSVQGLRLRLHQLQSEYTIELVQLYEGLVRPTKLAASPRDHTIYTRLPEANANYRGKTVVMDNGYGEDTMYVCLKQGEQFKWFSLSDIPDNNTDLLGRGVVGRIKLS